VKTVGGLVLEKTGICRLKGFPVPHAFSSTKLGNMSRKYGEDAPKNQALFFDLVGINPEKVIKIVPEFKDKVLVVNETIEERLECDGLITFRKGTVLALLPGDCAPIIITDSDLTFVALLHAGRKNLFEILDSAMKKIKDFVFSPNELLFGIGPSIKGCCYLMDLPNEIKNYLIGNHGILPSQIFDANVCTFCTKIGKEYLFFPTEEVKNSKKKKEGSLRWLGSKAGRSRLFL